MGKRLCGAQNTKVQAPGMLLAVPQKEAGDQKGQQLLIRQGFQLHAENVLDFFEAVDERVAVEVHCPGGVSDASPV